MKKNLFCLGTYVLQRDMRIRLPKALLSNLPLKCGETGLGVYVDKENNEIVLKIQDEAPSEETSK